VHHARETFLSLHYSRLTLYRSYPRERYSPIHFNNITYKQIYFNKKNIHRVELLLAENAPNFPRGQMEYVMPH
jgi:hypothetical protein